MEISNLPKTLDKKLRRLGQGHGSGRGKTGGRGTKGQKARGKVPTFFEGGGLPLTKRMPFLRGRGRNKIRKVHPIEVNLRSLSKVPSKSIIDVETLVKLRVVDSSATKAGVKLIGSEKLEKIFEVKVATSAGAKKSITAAGGSVI
jgi:large subunit ribosomal protein L15